jgi:G6PDH family F420-dependent oxidoreductase
MTEFGYFLSSEEHGPTALVDQARRAAAAGFASVWISDHFHPWLDEQGHSPFVWSVIGAIAASTDLRVTTAVTCPTTRLHPAVIAQAAATSALLLDGRFELGVGSGEYLNEHVTGAPWPATDLRLDMLDEAVTVMRALWTGEEVTIRGRYYTVEDARIYSRPDRPPPLFMSGFGPKSTDLAARIADGYISTRPDADLLDRYRAAGGRGPASAGLKVCWGGDADRCAELAHRLWRSSGVPGELSQELRTPALFAQASKLVTVDASKESVPCGPDPEPILDAVRPYLEAGFDRVYINQIGPEQAGFFDFYRRELDERLRALDDEMTGGRSAEVSAAARA